MAPVSDVAWEFHRALPGYAPTPLVEVADRVWLKDESGRFGLPAFKVLGASWAVECALRRVPGTHTLVAASAGNHGRAVAHVARLRGLRARVFLPARSLAVRRAAIASEGAEVVVVDGSYEDACALAAIAGAEPGAIELADVGATPPARDVVDGYATLFAELDQSFDVLLVPIGVGSLGAAAARHGAATGTLVVGIEPLTAACLTASLQTGEPTVIQTPGTTMAGLDCAEVSIAAWPDLHAGIAATITVTDDQVAAARAELADKGLYIGESGAAPYAALARARAAHPDARIALIATEGPTAG